MTTVNVTENRYTITTSKGDTAIVPQQTVAVVTAGTQGPQGPAGPNNVTGSTTTNLTGYLKGNGSAVSAQATPIPVADGGTGTATPALVAGSNVTITGTWPNQTIAAIGGSPGGSSGQVQFNSGGSFGADSNLFWDNTNKRLGVGTASPNAKLSVVGSLAVNENVVDGLLTIFDSTNTRSDHIVLGYSSGAKYTIGRNANAFLEFRFNQLGGGYTFYTAANAIPISMLDTGLVGVGFGQPTGQLHVQTQSASRKALIVQGAASQTANLQEWQDSSAARLGFVDSIGRLVLGPDYPTYTPNGQGPWANEVYGLYIRSNSTRPRPMFLESDQPDASIDFKNTGSGGRHYNFGSTNNGSGAGAGFIIYSVTSNRLAFCIRGNSDLHGITTFNPQGQLHVTSTGATVKTLVAQAAASQTANLQEWQNSAGTALTYIDANGRIVIANQPNSGVATAIAPNSPIASYSAISVGPISGNAAAALDLSGRGTFGSNGVRAQITVYGTDVYADPTNYEFATFRATSGLFSFSTGKSGTGSNRPFMLASGFASDGSTNLNQLYLNTDGRIGIFTNTPSALFHVNNQTASVIAQIVRGAASQSANLQEWQDSSSSVIARIDASGNIYPRSANANFGFVTGSSSFTDGNISFSGASLQRDSSNGQLKTNISLTVNTLSASAVPLIAKGAASQSANLQEWQNSAGTALVALNAAGNALTTPGRFAIGELASTTLDNDLAIGRYCSANGGIGIGYFSSGTGGSSTAVGFNCAASNGAFAFGVVCNASAYGASAIGFACQASAGFSGAYGAYANATQSGEFCFSGYNNNGNIKIQVLTSGTGSSVANTTMMQAAWADSNHATRKGRMTLSAFDASAAREGLRIESDGTNALTAIGGNVLSTTRTTIYTGAAANKGLVVQGAASQSANLTEWQDSAGTVVASLSANGSLTSSGVVTANGSLDLNTTRVAPHLGVVSGIPTLFLSAGLGSLEARFDNPAGYIRTVVQGQVPVVFYSNNTTFFAPVNATSITASGSGSFTATNASTVGLIVKGAAAQTANLQEWQNSGGTVLANITAAGFLNCIGADLGAGIITDFRADVATNAGTSFTIGSSDTGRIIEATAATAVSVTLSATATAGTTVTVAQAGAGQITFASTGSGVVRNRQSQFKTAGQWAVATAYVRANVGGSAAEWVLAGDLAA